MSRRNFLLTLAYEGTSFAGWQRGPAEKGQRTVQREVETCLAAVLGEEVQVTGASRTDAGVHAEGQAASFHSRTSLSPEGIAEALEAAFPRDLHCRGCREVDPRFHARYRAKGKLYRYRLQVGVPDPALRPWSLYVEGPLDLPAMKAAAAALVGSHDFRAFTNEKAKVDCRRRLDAARVEQDGPRVDLLFQGDGFLYNQVRIMASAILEAGKGRLSVDELRRALADGDRRAIPGALGAFGLTLVEVHF
jgi:tRNA pseudouridine38-40 synthase